MTTVIFVRLPVFIKYSDEYSNSFNGIDPVQSRVANITRLGSCEGHMDLFVATSGLQNHKPQIVTNSEMYET